MEKKTKTIAPIIKERETITIRPKKQNRSDLLRALVRKQKKDKLNSINATIEKVLIEYFNI